MTLIRRTLLVLSICCTCLPSANSATPSQAGIATAHPLATAAGHDILAAGGNAFDAAVAISATLAVVEPFGSGIGGGGFWLLYIADQKRYVMIDGRETTPAAGHKDMYLDNQGNVIPGRSIDGPLAAGIPGLPAALAHLAKRYGNLPLKKSLAPAIRHSRDGFQVSPHYRTLANFRLDALNRWPEAADIFLADGLAPEIGQRIIQKDLAATLQALADHGHAGFYQGKIAGKLVDGIRADGGIWTLADLKNYKVVERQPVTGSYRDLKIVSAAPPSSGGIALVETLNILQEFDLNKLSPVTQKHVIIEAMRRAYRDRAQYLGDPDFVAIPDSRLLSAAHARQLASSINAEKATPSQSLPAAVAGKEGDNTTHFSVLDKAGNRVAATLSINYPFGAAYVPPGTGVLLNDELDDFSAKPGIPNAYGLVGSHANAIAPGKRPLSSMSPTFVESEHGIAILGTPGGSRIISMVLLGILQYAQGADAQTIAAYPRFHHQYLPDVVQYETRGLETEEIKALERLGHATKDIGRPYGDMQVVLWQRADNRVSAASDPRREGQASVK